MKTILALFLALATLAAGQVRQEPPKEVSLRNVRVTSKEFKEAYAAVSRQIETDKLKESGEQGLATASAAAKSKDNPDGALITEKEFHARLKKGEKFTIQKFALGTCDTCKGNNPKECKSCNGVGKMSVSQTTVYLW